MLQRHYTLNITWERSIVNSALDTTHTLLELVEHIAEMFRVMFDVFFATLLIAGLTGMALGGKSSALHSYLIFNYNMMCNSKHLIPFPKFLSELRISFILQI